MGNTKFVTHVLKTFYQVWNPLHAWGNAGKNGMRCSTPVPIYFNPDLSYCIYLISFFSWYGLFPAFICANNTEAWSLFNNLFGVKIFNLFFFLLLLLYLLLGVAWMVYQQILLHHLLVFYYLILHLHLLKTIFCIYNFYQLSF